MLLPETRGVRLPETIDDIEFPNRYDFIYNFKLNEIALYCVRGFVWGIWIYCTYSVENRHKENHPKSQQLTNLLPTDMTTNKEATIV